MKGDRAAKETMALNLKDELVRTVGIAVSLYKEIRSFKPDVIHVNTSCSPTGVLRDALCVFLAWKKTPIILHCRCNVEDQLGNKKISLMAFEYMVRKASKVIVLNKFSKKYVDRLINGKTTFIPNYANEKMIDDNHFIKEEIRSVLYVGHIERAKGLEQIIETARMISDVSFVLVGAVREDISGLEIPSNISFIGRVDADAVKSYLRDADIFLFPSLTEGFSNAVLEAMAMGIPIIASDVGANSEMIEESGGVVLKHNNAEEICKAIDCLRDRNIREKCSRWNVEKVRREYLIDPIMDRYFNLYKEVANRT